MKPKEKALELFEFYYMYVDKPYETNAKQCALKAVDEILNKDGYNNDYWKKVKQELENL